MSTDFICGGEYSNTTGVPRKTCCATCAFREGPGTVRSPGVEPADVWAQTELCDDFICHTPNDDGTYPSCAGWHAWQAQDQLPEKENAPWHERNS